jgi:hypothetical protein
MEPADSVKSQVRSRRSLLFRMVVHFRRPWYWIVTAVVFFGVLAIRGYVRPDAFALEHRADSLLIAIVAALILPIYIAGFVTMLERAADTEELRERSERALYDLPDSEVGAKQSDGAKVQPAWDLARATLEQYWQRNSLQNWLIFMLSVTAIVAGFTVMVIGAQSALAGKPVGAAALPVVAGVMTQFIGATFLFVYRSTMQQMTIFNATLERINSVGMAWYVVQSMSEDTAVDRGLKNRLRGRIALEILNARDAASTGSNTKMDDAPAESVSSEPRPKSE